LPAWARQQVADRIALDRARVPIGLFDCDVGGALDAIRRHADLRQRPWQAEPPEQVEQALGASPAPSARRIAAIASGAALAL